MNPVFAEAVSYLERGWSVLPLKPRTKVPATLHGKKDASSDPDLVARWFINAEQNIGVLTGNTSRLLVVDIDPRNDGWSGLSQLEGRFGRLPKTLTAQTGGGGCHYYYKLPDDAPKTFDRPNVLGCKGVDLKADGYVVAPPSIHESGLRYEWEEGEIADAPQWLVDLACKERRHLKEKASSQGAIAEGSRNDTLFRMACSLMRSGLDHEQVLTTMNGHNAAKCEPPLDGEEILAIVDSAFRYESEISAPIDQLFNSKRLVRLLDGDARYEPNSDLWYFWNGSYWRHDRDGEIMRRAIEVLAGLREEAASIEDPDARQKRMKQIERSENHSQLTGAIKLAAVAPGIPIEFAQFDRQPHLLNVANGTIDLRTGRIAPHSRDDLITHLIDIHFDPDVSCPAFEKFVDEICAGDGDLVRYLQRAIGYAATGLTTEQCFFILHGSGANGKSTFLNLIRSTLGEYAKHTPTETLLARQTSAPGNDLIRLAGTRFVTASEASADQRMADGLLKQITGDEPVTARYLFKEFVEFKPQFKLFLATNHLPQLDGADPAIWRRVRTIPFDRVFTKDQQDPQLYEKLVAEGPGVLAWIISGAKFWFNEGLVTPKRVEAATLEYSKEMDPIGQFIEDFCTTSSSAAASASLLHLRFSAFAAERGLEAMNATRFGKILTAKGFGREKRNGMIVRLGLALAA